MISIFCLSFLTGCFGSHAPNDTALINVLGLDKSENGDYEITLLIYRPEALFSNSRARTEGGVISTPLFKTTITGKGIFEVFEKASSVIAKRLVWTHMDVIVIGEELAKDGIRPIFDFMKRENEFRLNNKVLITKGKASDILSINPLTENNLGAEIYNINVYSQFHTTPIVHDVAKMASLLRSDTSDPFTGEISKTSPSKIAIEEIGVKPQVSPDQVKPSFGVNLDGLAVFKRDQLVGWLNNEEARSVGFIRGKVKNSVIVLDCPDKDGFITVETTKTSSKLKPSFLDGNAKMNVNIKVHGTLKEMTCSNLIVDSNLMEQLNKQLEKEMKKEIKKVLTKVQTQWQSDIFGFGETIYKHQPKVWHDLAPTWRHGGLSSLNVKLSINANLSRNGLIRNPITTKE